MNRDNYARRELFIIFGVALAFAILELFVPSISRAMLWATQNESLLITEIFTLALVSAIGLGIYAYRRWREAEALAIEKEQLKETVSHEQDVNLLIRTYADAITRGQEAERHRLARELHDDTIQRLILLNQKAELAAFDHAGSPAAADLSKMQGVIDETIGHVRDFIRDLRPTYLDELGLVTALRTLTKETRERTDLFIEFDVTGPPCRCAESVELALYRIVQSSLSNIVQHSEASTAQVKIDFLSEAIELSIRDDGKGFEPMDERALVQGGHFGLIGMRERAELLGAKYELTSAPNAGTHILVKVPISPR